jgi:preprotein translocase subunit SecA
MYKKLSGMTGTATTSAEELSKVYKLDVMEIPTNKPMIREDLSDVVYKSEAGKFNAIVSKIKEINAKRQPALVGTIAIEKSEYLSSLLSREGVEHAVLNAKFHEKEASIISKAGQAGAVTIATNMAGRGTDIKLGEGVRESGGLYIIGTERHEARRIDNQLRGRSGRQGDPGVTQFYVSLEDELMRRFGGDKLKSMMESLGLPEDQPIQNAIISKSIESAQSKIEGYNFDIRKHVLDYDDVMNKQREVIYKKRKEVLEAKDAKNEIIENIKEQLERMVSVYCLKGAEAEWDIKCIFDEAKSIFPISPDTKKQLEIIRDDRVKNDAEKIGAIIDYLFGEAKLAYGQKEQEIGMENLRRIEKIIILQTIDTLWMNHLDEIDYLRQGIGLRGYGQRDPLIEYKREAFNMFSRLMDNIRGTIVSTIFRVSIAPANLEAQMPAPSKDLQLKGADENVEQFSDTKDLQSAGGSETKEEVKQKPIVNKDVIGRNDPCPCGSGKKYKKCCGK